MTRSAIVLLALLAAGCPKKEEEAKPPADAAPAVTASASAGPTDTAAPGTATPGSHAALPSAPPNVPGISTDPNAPPTNDDHDKAATAQVQKGNYKAELDKLEKEDLSADKK
jgi:hypothetical protein